MNAQPKNPEGPLDIEQIQAILPHRYPFLLVDRVLEIHPNRIVAMKNVTCNEPFFQGHFPGLAVMPGVLMIEALAQTGGVLMLSRPGNKGKLAFLASINDAKFRRMVRPGDTLTLEAEVIREKSRVGILKGVARVGDDVACSAEILFSLGASPEAPA